VQVRLHQFFGEINPYNAMLTKLTTFPLDRKFEDVNFIFVEQCFSKGVQVYP